jgi:hypothetical protein
MTALDPEGDVYLSVDFNAGYGQSSPTGDCTNWSGELQNRSDTGVYDITIEPSAMVWMPSGRYGNDARPVPAVAKLRPIDMHLAPGESQELEFQICTSTPSPGSEYEIAAQGLTGLTWYWDQ